MQILDEFKLSEDSRLLASDRTVSPLISLRVLSPPIVDVLFGRAELTLSLGSIQFAAEEPVDGSILDEASVEGGGGGGQEFLARKLALWLASDLISPDEVDECGLI